MYLLEHFSRFQEDGREDTVSIYMPSIPEEALSPGILEVVSSFMRMAATLAKLTIVQGRPDLLEHACRVLNRVMEDCAREP
jgi:hypothetical protein